MDLKRIAFLMHNFFLASCLKPPSFISGWEAITAYDNPEVVIPHTLGEMPVYVDVEVRVFDSTLGKYLYFPALSSAHRGNDDAFPFGGVIFMYNENEVRLLAPGPLSCIDVNCRGGVVYLGGSHYIGETVDGFYYSGHVRVKMWAVCDMPKPTYMKNLTDVQVLAPKNMFILQHNSLKNLDLVTVQVFLPNGYVTHGQGSAFYTDSSTYIGGVLYAHNSSHIQIWVPTRAAGDPPTVGVFNAMNGWGIAGDSYFFESASVLIWAWSYKTNPTAPMEMSTTIYKSPGVEEPKSVILSKVIDDNNLLSVTVKPFESSLNSINNGLNFPAIGSAPTVDSLSAGVGYGGVVFAHDNSRVYIWVPNSTETGCVSLVGGIWGGGSLPVCANNGPEVIVSLSNTVDPADMVCRDLECFPSLSGASCNCTGTGKVGQYCTVLQFCPPPTKQVNATFSPGDGSYPGDSVTFSCLPGYNYTSGDYNSTCSLYFTWPGEPFLCEPVVCGIPEDGVMATISVLEGTTFQQRVKYACNQNYSLSAGNLRRKCGADQLWTGSPPICAKTCYTPTINEGVERLNWGESVNVTAVFDCKPGWQYLSGNYTQFCQLDSVWPEWQGQPLQCERKSCSMPVNGLNSFANFTDALFESSVTYICDMGYHFMNEDNVTQVCQADQTWSGVGSTINCQKKQCPPLDEGVNANLAVAGNLYQDVATYDCHYGYYVYNGSLARTCQANQTWDGEPLICGELQCPSPNPVEFGTMQLSGMLVGDFIAVNCDEGYMLKSGDLIRFCNNTGHWQGNEPVCAEIIYAFVQNLNQSISDLDLGGLRLDNLINERMTSKNQRKLTSASDNRWSAKLLGATGILFLVGFVTFFVFLDAWTFFSEKNNKKAKELDRQNRLNMKLDKHFHLNHIYF